MKVKLLDSMFWNPEWSGEERIRELAEKHSLTPKETEYLQAVSQNKDLIRDPRRITVIAYRTDNKIKVFKVINDSN